MISDLRFGPNEYLNSRGAKRSERLKSTHYGRFEHPWHFDEVLSEHSQVFNVGVTLCAELRFNHLWTGTVEFFEALQTSRS